MAFRQWYPPRASKHSLFKHYYLSARYDAYPTKQHMHAMPSGLLPTHDCMQPPSHARMNLHTSRCIHKSWFEYVGGYDSLFSDGMGAALRHIARALSEGLRGGLASNCASISRSTLCTHTLNVTCHYATDDRVRISPDASAFLPCFCQLALPVLVNRLDQH